MGSRDLRFVGVTGGALGERRYMMDDLTPPGTDSFGEETWVKTFNPRGW